MKKFLLFIHLFFVSTFIFAGEPVMENKSPKSGGGIIRINKFPKEAYIVPEEHLLLVNHKGALSDEWLETEREYMQRQLSVSVKVLDFDKEIGTDIIKFVDDIKAAAGDKAKMFIIISADEKAPIILSSPMSQWVIMNSKWVDDGSTNDKDLVNARMGKRIFQALGYCVGAGLRIEKEAVMRYTPNAAALDDCLSHGFHPLNSQVFMLNCRAVNLPAIRLRPRKELIEMGLIKGIQK